MITWCTLPYSIWTEFTPIICNGFSTSLLHFDLVCLIPFIEFYFLVIFDHYIGFVPEQRSTLMIIRRVNVIGKLFFFLMFVWTLSNFLWYSNQLFDHKKKFWFQVCAGGCVRVCVEYHLHVMVACCHSTDVYTVWLCTSWLLAQLSIWFDYDYYY